MNIIQTVEDLKKYDQNYVNITKEENINLLRYCIDILNGDNKYFIYCNKNNKRMYFSKFKKREANIVFQMENGEISNFYYYLSKMLRKIKLQKIKYEFN